MKRQILTTIAATAALALATAAAQAHSAPANYAVGAPITFTVHNGTGLRQNRIDAADAAITKQVSQQFRRYWPGRPIRFGSGGFPIYVEPYATVAWVCQANVAACHGPNWIFAGYSSAAATPGDWTLALDHEVLETLVDPSGTGQEVADPVQTPGYKYAGWLLSDFVFPNYFQAGSVGPRDLLHQLH